MNTRHPIVIGLAIVLGLALIVLAVVYWAEPAKSLPSWFPRHESGSSHHHITHERLWFINVLQHIQCTRAGEEIVGKWKFSSVVKLAARTNFSGAFDIWL